MDDHSNQIVATDRAGDRAASGAGDHATGHAHVATAEREQAVVALWGELSRTADQVRSGWRAASKRVPARPPKRSSCSWCSPPRPSGACA